MAKRKWLILAIVFSPLVFTCLFWGVVGGPISRMLAHKERGTANTMADIPYVAKYTNKEFADFPSEGEIKYALWDSFFAGPEIFFSSVAPWESVETYCKKHHWAFWAASPDHIEKWSKMLRSHGLDQSDFPIAELRKGLDLYSTELYSDTRENDGSFVVYISYRQEDGRFTGRIVFPWH